MTLQEGWQSGALSLPPLKSPTRDAAEMSDDTPVPEPEYWVMHFDGSKLLNGLGADVLLQSPTGEKLHYVLQIHFEASNNMTEYESFIHELRVAKDIGTWNARNPMMEAYQDEVDEIAKCFEAYEVKYVKREENETVDLLSKLGSGRKPILPGVFLEHLWTPSVKEADLENPDRVDSFVNAVTIVPLAWTKPCY